MTSTSTTHTPHPLSDDDATVAAGNIRLVQELFDSVNAGDLTVLDRVVADDYRQHDASVPPGRAGLRLYFQGLRQAFPDLTFEAGQFVADRRRVACVVRATGTQHGPAFGVPASGRTVSSVTVEMFAVHDGLLSEHWASVDTADIVRQLRGEPDGRA